MSHDDRYLLETPENIEIQFDLAGVGSRFCALALDWLIMAAIGLVLMLGSLAVGISWAWLFDEGADAGTDLGLWWMAIVVAILVTLTSGGYFILFELLMRGQTPGKRAMRLRVLRDDGTPARPADIVIRNLLRIVDFLPALYGVGLITMFVHPLSKRLGDLAAGTIVVKEGELDYRGQADRRYKVESALPETVNRELKPEERRLVSGYLLRRGELLPEARSQLASRLANPLFEKYGGHFGDAESYLERLIEGRQHEPA